MPHNSNSKNDSCISEECYICNQELTNTKDILVDIKTDQYLCHDCANYNNIEAVKCDEY